MARAKTEAERDKLVAAQRKRAARKERNYVNSRARAGDRSTIKYKEIPEFIMFNENDPDLEPIKVPLPKPTNIKNIDGYGLTVHHQVFRTHRELNPEVWKRLMYLQRDLETVDACIEELRMNKDKYEKEIAFIQLDHKRFKEGYFFFCNGVPTYITGAHYRYLNYWHAGSSYPQYRSRDRKFFIFAEFVDDDPFACGFNYPKFRREGATSKTACLMYHKITMSRSAHGGIQSKDDVSASRVFKNHIVQNWKKLPFWQKPTHEGKAEPKASLNFFPVSTSVGNKGTAAGFEDSLESWIDFGSSTEGHYDGDKLRFHYGDEVGKVKEIDVYKRHLVVKPCVTEGNKYIGLIVNTSTVGDMDKGGGENFRILCSGSHYNKRNENNETSTGLYNMFIPSYDGFSLEDKITGKNYIDRYGNSNIEVTKQFLENRRKALREAGDDEGLAEEIRQFPFTFAECFRGGATGCNFNVNILNDRLDTFRFGNPNIVEGNFVWQDDVKDSKVIWVPAKGGRFKVSYLLPSGQDNKQSFIGDIKIPGNKRFGCAGGDPFRFDEVTSNKKSDGAGAVFMNYDASIDDPTGDKELWKSDRFCCTYSNHPKTRELYGEDMILMCVYYGIEMFSEINVTALIDHFRARGYGGYLFYKRDPKTGKYAKNPGDTTLAKVQQDIFGSYYSYIERCGHRENHDEILKQCLEIGDDMGPYDLFVAGGYALMGSRRQEIVSIKQNTNISFHRKIKYS